MNLSGKTALITGGTMRIGAAIAVELARGGVDVALVARHRGAPAEKVVREIESLGRRVFVMTGDLAQEKDCIAAIDETVKQFGRLDVLVHNAGGPSPGRIDQIATEQWLATMALHVNALFFLARAAIPHLRKQSEGAIVTVSSTVGMLGVDTAR